MPAVCDYVWNENHVRSQPVRAQICGLKWSPCGQQLASGGNDNVLCIWDSQFRLLHKISAHQVRQPCRARAVCAWLTLDEEDASTGRLA